MYKKAYLKTVRISKGQFSCEKAVQVTTYDGTETSGFFEDEYIKEYIKDKGLLVTIIEEKDELALIKLPGRMLEAPGDKGYITVKKQSLEYL
ncbi:MAG: hypothetical protein PHH54_04830 [Candidatus Nanoarchaeia archaeon]|nr:hypothetical protein [Candidatus Nanoarchaeia archaeon]MDD5741282.1 hypothetical protein [Candidatus Nanoarchaeia archaeon]